MGEPTRIRGMGNKDLSSIAAQIAAGRKDLFEAAIENGVEPIYLQYEVALILDSPDKEELRIAVEKRKADEAALQDELHRLSMELGKIRKDVE